MLRTRAASVSHVMLLAALALGCAGPALADDEESTGTAAPGARAEKSGEPGGLLVGRRTGSVQWDSTNAYFFRGILQERRGYIAEPWGELYYSLYSSEDGFIRDFSIGSGVWASFHTKETLAEHGPRSLYETDWYPVVYLEFP